MAPDSSEVKGKFLSTVDAHPRVGWYIAVVVTANFLETIFHPIATLVGG